MVSFGPLWLKRGRRNTVGSINSWGTVWGNCIASFKFSGQLYVGKLWENVGCLYG
jgi:hypothetical protein